MAHLMPEIEHRIPGRKPSPPTGISRAVTRRYLYTQLEEIDAQILTLRQAQTREAWHSLERAAWLQPAAAEIVWTNWLELHYLYAVREALLEALTYL